MIVSVSHAKAQLSKLIAAALAGEEVIIACRGRSVAKLTALTPDPKRRTPGRLKGQIAWSDAFFDPLPDNELALRNGEGD